MSDDFDDFDDFDDEGETVPASSLLAGLRERQDQARESLHFDYKVPKLWPLHVRYRPADATEIKSTVKLSERNRKRDDGEVLAQASLLARCCLGVFDVGEDGDPIGEQDDWPTFGPELAEILGMDVARPRAADVVRALYLRDGDITSAFNQLVVDSGYVLDELEETEAGN